MRGRRQCGWDLQGVKSSEKGRGSVQRSRKSKKSQEGDAWGVPGDQECQNMEGPGCPVMGAEPESKPSTWASAKGVGREQFQQKAKFLRAEEEVGKGGAETGSHESTWKLAKVPIWED